MICSDEVGDGGSGGDNPSNKASSKKGSGALKHIKSIDIGNKLKELIDDQGQGLKN